MQPRTTATRLERLKSICEQILRKPLSPDENIIDAGLNANRALNIIRLFYLETGLELDVNSFLEHPSLADLDQMLSRGQTGSDQKLILLHRGTDPQDDIPLFVYAGGVNVFIELHDLTRAIAHSGPVYGIRVTLPGRPCDDPVTVADEVGIALDAIRQRQPEGPVRILGYSFGGILALEVARALRAEGRTVTFCGMLDTPQNDHVWPFHYWIGFVAQRLMQKMRLTARNTMGPHKAIRAAPPILQPEDLHRLSAPKRGHQLGFRFRDPRQPNYPYYAPQWQGGNTPNYTRHACEMLRMKGLYRPQRHEGPVTFFISSQGSPVDCNARAIWLSYLPNAEWVSVKGNHLSMVVGRNASTLAAEISGRLLQVRAIAPPQAKQSRANS